MIEYFTDAFSSELTQRALLGGLLAAVTMALVGSWVVVRGLSFAGDALAHGVLPGIALAVLWGFDVTLGALGSAVVMMAGVSVARRTGRISDDAGIGLLFAGMLALGVIIISREDTYAGELTGLLFGDVLGVSVSDLRFQAVVAVATLVALVALYRPLLALSFDPRKAAVLGQRPALTHTALLVLLALAVVASFRVVGTMLVMGLLIAPAATALLTVRRMLLVQVVSVLFGCLAVVVGLAVSYHADTAASATVAGVAVGMFFVVAWLRSLASTFARLRS
ncbi:MAG TPA: metal ABC transporter permease [Acidimicrobiales bacterium]